jgi:hypothetical protein
MLTFVIMSHKPPLMKSNCGRGFFFAIPLLDEEGDNAQQCESTDGHAQFDHFHGGEKMPVEREAGGVRVRPL